MPLSSTAQSLSSSASAISRVGRFYITRELGRGAVGCVYLAHDPVLGRDIALKTFHPRLAAGERNRLEQQFINEARAAARLSHPNIVTIFDASIEGATSYIAMEYLQGAGLDRQLDKGRRFTPEAIAAIVGKLADALAHAHRNGVVHRDIKPANIFMLEDDQPKLVDFGIARAPNRAPEQCAGDGQPYTLFRNNLLGTPNYMSPEQASGKPVDARTDIYSLGAVMYEMLTGRKPFQGNDQDDLLQQIAYKAPQAPHLIDPDVSEALSQVAMKAMNKRPEKRYRTADDMARDIRRFMTRRRRARRGAKTEVRPLQQATPTAPERLISTWVLCVVLAGAAATAGIALLR
jgi:serine/threonine-protein kinase